MLDLPQKIERALGGRDWKRELIREYFNWTCQQCGKIWIEGQRRFDTHHFSCKKEDTQKYDVGEVEEIIKAVSLLCHKCHLNLPEHRKAMSKSHKDRAVK